MIVSSEISEIYVRKPSQYWEHLYLRNKQTNHNLTTSQNIQDLPYKESFMCRNNSSKQDEIKTCKKLHNFPLLVILQLWKLTPFFIFYNTNNLY